MFESQYEETIETLKKKLFLSEKRYEVVMGFSDVAMFDYNVVTKKIITQHEDFEIFGIPGEVENGVEDLISSGLIATRSFDDIREIYIKIDNGEPTANTTVFAYDTDGNERVVELLLVNIYNEIGEPVYAVGVRKDVTDSLQLKKENAYKVAVSPDTVMAFEANISTDRFTSHNRSWFETMGLTEVSSVSRTFEQFCTKAVSPEYRAVVLGKLSNEMILNTYQNGENLISCESKLLMPNGEHEWFETTVHIIADELTGDINIRCYNKNIHKQKEKEIKAVEEQYYYESMVSKSDAVYEFNLTKNTTISGYENWSKQYGIDLSHNYSKMMHELYTKAVHPHDRDEFKERFFLDKLLTAYNEDGVHDVTCEYRRPDATGEFIWVSNTMHMFEDPLTGDIKGYSYVHSIDAQKKAQLELLFKSQRDSLTGFYNKATLQEKISDFLLTSDGLTGSHAFFIMDLDHFKDINDNFGHAFGDVFLSQTALKIKALFREEDIWGRVGGDEFVVFMKNIQGDKIIHSKANELCRILSEVYPQNDMVHRVSVSIGIAVYDVHGKTFDELYKNSDTALYYSKNHGRNQFAIYNPSMQLGASNIKEIDNERHLHGKVFQENISEYVFRILYESTDKEVAINSVLALICKYYVASRVYIFEISPNGQFAKYTFEWCAQGVDPNIETRKEVSLAGVGDYQRNFNSDGYFCVQHIESQSPAMRELLAPQDALSILQFSIMKNGKFVAILGLDQCDRIRTPTLNELSDIRNMANVIGIFITEMRAIENVVAAKQMASSVVNGLASYAYVCDPLTHQVLFINDRLLALIPNVSIGDICHDAFWCNSEVCDGCPMKELAAGTDSKLTKEMYNTHLKMWVRVTASWVDWLQGEKACLIDSVDITQYVRNKENYSS